MTEHPCHMTEHPSEHTYKAESLRFDHVDEVWPLVQAFFEESPHLPGTLRHEAWKDFWQRAIFAGSGRILVIRDAAGVPVGTLGFLIAPDPLDGRVVATEAHLYVAVHARGHAAPHTVLLAEYHRFAAQLGAVETRLTCLMDHQGTIRDGFKRLYGVWGYRPVEVGWVREASKKGA